MILWLDAQLSPSIATWIQDTFRIATVPVRDVGLRDASDSDIFFSARNASAVVMTKDSDFVTLSNQHLLPPQLILLTCGNTSNARLQAILLQTLP